MGSRGRDRMVVGFTTTYAIRPFYCHVTENLMRIEPLLRVHLSYKATFSFSQ
jgi:hypothetical protein